MKPSLGPIAAPSSPLSATPAEHLIYLASFINHHDQKAHHHVVLGVYEAIECGRALIEAKALVAHGEWIPWLEKNVTVRPRQAQNYMRLAEGYGNTQTAYLTLESALAALAQTRPKPALGEAEPEEQIPPAPTALVVKRYPDPPYCPHGAPRANCTEGCCKHGTFPHRCLECSDHPVAAISGRQRVDAPTDEDKHQWLADAVGRLENAAADILKPKALARLSQEQRSQIMMVCFNLSSGLGLPVEKASGVRA